MTAIFGVVGRAEDQATELICSRGVNAQQAYSSRTVCGVTLEGALFSVSPTIRGQSPGQERPVTAVGRWLLVADARIDNRAELMRSLGGGLDRHGGDAALILQAWIKWGPDCLDFLIGDYALAVYDAKLGSLTLARDPTGQRTLFFLDRDGAVSFSSMPSGLRAAYPGLEIDLRTQARRLAGLPQCQDLPLFTGIERVRPGETMTFKGPSSVRREFWQPRLTPLSHGAGATQIVEQFRHLLDEAVRCRLERSWGSLASHLSSGYDSSAVTATAARLGKPENLTAFTSAPLFETVAVERGRRTDETSLAALTAARCGIDHVIVRKTRPLFDAIRKVSRSGQAPVASPFTMVWWTRISEMARERGASVLLTGQMGNLSLSAGGLGTLAEWTRDGNWQRWLHQACAAARRPDVRLGGIAYGSFGHFLPDKVWGAVRHRLMGRPALFDAEFVRSEWREQVRGPSELRRPTGRTSFDRLQSIKAIDPGMLRKAALMDDGIDERDPTSDRRLIEFSLGLSPEYLLDDGVYKPLARAALTDRLPREILDSPLRGLQGADWAYRLDKGEAQTVFDEISSCSQVGELLDLPALQRALDDWPARLGEGATFRKFGWPLVNALATGIFIHENSASPAATGSISHLQRT